MKVYILASIDSSEVLFDTDSQNTAKKALEAYRRANPDGNYILLNMDSTRLSPDTKKRISTAYNMESLAEIARNQMGGMYGLYGEVCPQEYEELVAEIAKDAYNNLHKDFTLGDAIDAAIEEHMAQIDRLLSMDEEGDYDEWDDDDDDNEF